MSDKKTSKRRIAGKYDWDGSCAPKPGDCRHWETFSVGVFRWVLTTDLSRLERGPVRCRIYGHSSYPDAVYQLAEHVCDLLDLHSPGIPKTVRVDSRTARRLLGISV